MGADFVNTDAVYLTLSNLSGFAFCIFIVAFINVVLANRNNSHSRFTFKRLILLSIICLIVDMLAYTVSARLFFGAKFLHSVFLFARVLLTVCVGCFWNDFFDVAFHIQRVDKTIRVICGTIAILTVAALTENLFTGHLFYIDEGNVYTRGSLAFINFILQYFPMLILLFRALFYKHKTRTIRNLKLRVSFIWVSAIWLLFGLLQILALGKIAFHFLGVTASIFIMFLRFQDNQITSDLLTGLNNRYALDAYIEDRAKLYIDGMHGRAQLYLIMMDINDFKRINDIYGHLEGDKALKTVASTLKTVGASHREHLFVARFGGDEFSAVFETYSEHKVAELCEEIKRTLKDVTEENKYRLTIGTGYALYAGKTMSFTELYENADKVLYEDKNKMKNGHQ